MDAKFELKPTQVRELMHGGKPIDAEIAPMFGDDRGYFTAINFGPDSKRAYVIKNHRAGIVRAFHGHKQESKALYAIRGAFKAVLINMETGEWKSFFITEKGRNMLRIPAGFYNGFASLAEDSELLIVSNKTYEESTADDIRVPYNILGKEVWEVEHR